MEYINIIFHIIAFLLASLAATILLWINKERRHSNKLLAYVLLILAFQNLMHIFIITKLIYNVPWLLRSFAPFTFLVGPFAYIYIRSVLNDELKFKKNDWVLFIPALLILINFIPFYILSNPEKVLYLEENFFNKNTGQDSGKGFMPCILYNIIRICWSGIFVFGVFKLIYSFKKNAEKEILSKNKILINWIITFNCLLTGIFISMVLRVFISTIKTTHITISDIMLGGTILFICLSLFVRPQILYGLFNPISDNGSIKVIQDQIHQKVVLKTDSSDEEIVIADTLNSRQMEQLRYKAIVEVYFSENNQFLQPSYSLHHLVLDTHIPRYVLSAFINKEYGMGFRAFLNRKKVEYIIANYDKPEWKQFTLEAIASECGYSSRTTFIKNFKEITGKTPSEYFKNNS